MRIFAALGLCLSLGACALVEDVVPISHAVSGVTATPGADAIRVAVVAVDSRTEHQERISAKINGYGAEMAAIRLDGEVTDVVREGLLVELRSRGYHLADGGARIEVKVATFYNTFTSGFLAGRADGKVDLLVTVAPEGAEPLYTRALKGRGRKPIQVASGKNAAAALSAAMADALQVLFGDPAFIKALQDAGAIKAVSASRDSSFD
ncbi:YajG family lipoprotein [Caulobacter endophyticus]|uniref:YajG family lipoprotein n=1 Tax=Caulobacter endophyticus TaxID=2172652 RepID=UPI0024101E19|nr:YajG family lipoprotein [Caulobacter endophyticus]MDG2527683.1 YajG family lipoprotein [Caulobacter endophyticus]